MIGSLIFTGLITLAASLGGLYNYSHDNISNSCSSSFGSHSSLYVPGSIQGALTPPSLYHYAIKFAPGIGSLAGKQLLSFYTGNVADTLAFGGDSSNYSSASEIELEDDGVLEDNSDDDEFYNSFELRLGYPNLLYSNPFLYTSDSSPKFGNSSYSGIGYPIRFFFNNIFGKYSYRLFIDFSSNTDLTAFYSEYRLPDGVYTDNYFYRDIVPSISSLYSFLISPGVQFELSSIPLDGESSYINAIYFERLITDSDVGFMGDGFEVGFEDGHIAGYDEGLDDANQPWTIMNGISVILGAFLNSILIVLSLEVFGIQLSYILGILVLLVGGIWILKLVRG